MHTEARLRRSWLAPHVGARRSWIAAPLVGLAPDDPGAGWGQAPTAQEKAQGYKKTDVMTLGIKCGQLKAQVDDLVANCDTAATDAASLAALKNLQANATALALAVAALQAGQLLPPYPLLLLKYNSLASELAGYGIEVAAPPAAAPSGGGPAVVVPPVVVKPAASAASPVITKKNKSSDWADYFLYGAIGLVIIGTGYGLKLWKF